MFHVADSLSVATTAIYPIVPPTPIWDAAGVYGALSEPVRSQPNEFFLERSPLVDNVWFQILILAVVGLYCLMIYYYRGQARMCLKGVFTFKAEDRFTAEHGHLYNSFIAFAVTLCTLGIGIAITKTIAVWASSVAIDGIPQWSVSLAAIVLWTVVAVVMTIEWGLLKVAGNFTFSGKLTAAITEIKNNHLAAMAVILTPAVLLWSGINPVWDRVMLWVIAVEGGGLLVSFVFRTFLLFVGQKVSILVWILYLCTVEIFPIAFVWTLVVKNF
jgi:hypothetical protein